MEQEYEKNLKKKLDELFDVLYNKENIQSILDELFETLSKKHADYGSDNLRKHGLYGINVRLSDKLARFDNLFNNRKEIKVKDESLYDTLMDLAGYALQALLLFENNL